VLPNPLCDTPVDSEYGEARAGAVAGGAGVMRVAVVSDTHLPAAGPLPEWIAEVVSAADHVLHAGDFLTAKAHFELRVLAGGAMTAVRGNRDPQLSLPAVDTVEVSGVRFVLTHGHDIGRGEAYERALVELAHEHEATVAVGGHTHRPLDTRRDGIRLLNPGSATGAPPADESTILLAEVDGSGISVTCRQD
jgi:putative phosphoesterase